MSLDQYFQIQAIVEQSAGGQFQKDKSMSTRVFNPDRLRSTSSDGDDPPIDAHNGLPMTLYQGVEMVEQLRVELKQSQETVSHLQKDVASLRAAAPPATRPSIALPPAATAKPATPAATSPAASSTGMIVNPHPAPTTAIEKLRSQLETAAPGQRDELYRRIKELESDTAVRAYKGSRR